jgi:hypothetical protein
VTVDATRSTAGTTASRVGVGQFCVSIPGTSAATRPASSSAGNRFTGTSTGAVAEVYYSGCANANSYLVFLKTESAGASGLADFTDDGSFTIVVP